MEPTVQCIKKSSSNPAVYKLMSVNYCLLYPFLQLLRERVLELKYISINLKEPEEEKTITKTLEARVQLPE